MLTLGILSYCIVMNIAAFILMGVDKHRAQTKAQRIPESTLLLIAVIGGSLGAVFGMVYFRHKTRKPKFVYTVPLLFFVQFMLFFLYLSKILR